MIRAEDRLVRDDGIVRTRGEGFAAGVGQPADRVAQFAEMYSFKARKRLAGSDSQADGA